ncbi:SDR family oxidoreductase [Ensifer adhaerens]|uniref:SDR family oxidoreductase n=1 Tax=Ensifer adhaerens TaxID=106592 RepID=UPI0018F7F51C|nr:SDR family oxidoreductase [Ensifer adhaerens]
MSQATLTKRYPEMVGKVALVTGGTSGIGLATAQAFAHEGAIVIIASRSEKRAKSALKLICGQADWIACDVTNGRQVEKLVASIVERHGGLDYAFNNGGSGGAGRPVGNMSEDAWRKTIDGYLTSAFLCMRHEVPAMLAKGGGVIVNNSSVDGLRGYPFPGGAAYAAAKHGVLGLTRSAALEYAKSGLRISAICPGWISTPPVEGGMKRDSQFAESIVAQEPIGRLGTASEVANGVLWLCSDAASFALGSPLILDGGCMT